MTSSHYLLPRGEGRGLFVSVNALIQNYSQVPRATTPRHLASLCQQQSFLLMHHRPRNYAINKYGREGLGYNQLSIQFTIHSFIHSLTHSLI